MRYRFAGPGASPSELDEFIARVTGAKSVFLILPAIWALIGVLQKPAFWAWTVSAAATLGVLGLLAIVQYEKRRTSVRALFLMLHGCLLSLGLLLLLFVEEIARLATTGNPLYAGYFWLYFVAFFATLLYVLLTSRWQRSLAEQMEMLAARAAEGAVDAQELFELLMHAPGAKKAFREWGPARFRLIAGATVVVTS